MLNQKYVKDGKPDNKWLENPELKNRTELSTMASIFWVINSKVFTLKIIPSWLEMI